MGIRKYRADLINGLFKYLKNSNLTMFIIGLFLCCPLINISMAMEGKIILNSKPNISIPSFSVALTDSDNKIIFQTQSSDMGMFSINTDKLTPIQKSEWAHKRLKLNIYTGYKGIAVFSNRPGTKKNQLFFRANFDPMQDKWDFNITISEADIKIITQVTADIEHWYRALFGSKSDFGLFPGIYREQYRLRTALIQALNTEYLPLTPKSAGPFLVVNFPIITTDTRDTKKEKMVLSENTWFPDTVPYSDFLLTKQLLSKQIKLNNEMIESISWAIIMDIHNKYNKKRGNLLTNLKSFGKKNNRSKTVIRSHIYLKLMKKADITLKSQKLILLFQKKENITFPESLILIRNDLSATKKLIEPDGKISFSKFKDFKCPDNVIKSAIKWINNEKKLRVIKNNLIENTGVVKHQKHNNDSQENNGWIEKSKKENQKKSSITLPINSTLNSPINSTLTPPINSALTPAINNSDFDAERLKKIADKALKLKHRTPLIKKEGELAKKIDQTLTNMPIKKSSPIPLKTFVTQVSKKNLKTIKQKRPLKKVAKTPDTDAILVNIKNMKAELKKLKNEGPKKKENQPLPVKNEIIKPTSFLPELSSSKSSSFSALDTLTGKAFSSKKDNSSPLDNNKFDTPFPKSPFSIQNDKNTKNKTENLKNSSLRIKKSKENKYSTIINNKFKLFSDQLENFSNEYFIMLDQVNSQKIDLKGFMAGMDLLFNRMNKLIAIDKSSQIWGDAASFKTRYLSFFKPGDKNINLLNKLMNTLINNYESLCNTIKAQKTRILSTYTASSPEMINGQALLKDAMENYEKNQALVKLKIEKTTDTIKKAFNLDSISDFSIYLDNWLIKTKDFMDTQKPDYLSRERVSEFYNKIPALEDFIQDLFNLEKSYHERLVPAAKALESCKQSAEAAFKISSRYYYQLLDFSKDMDLNEIKKGLLFDSKPEDLLKDFHFLSNILKPVKNFKAVTKRDMLKSARKSMDAFLTDNSFFKTSDHHKKNTVSMDKTINSNSVTSHTLDDANKTSGFCKFKNISINDCKIFDFDAPLYIEKSRLDNEQLVITGECSSQSEDYIGVSVSIDNARTWSKADGMDFWYFSFFTGNEKKIDIHITGDFKKSNQKKKGDIKFTIWLK